MMRVDGADTAIHFKKVCRRATVRSKLGALAMAAVTSQPLRANALSRSLYSGPMDTALPVGGTSSDASRLFLLRRG